LIDESDASEATNASSVIEAYFRIKNNEVAVVPLDGDPVLAKLVSIDLARLDYDAVRVDPDDCGGVAPSSSNRHAFENDISMRLIRQEKGVQEPRTTPAGIHNCCVGSTGTNNREGRFEKTA